MYECNQHDVSIWQMHFMIFYFFADNALGNLPLHTQGRLPSQLFCIIFFSTYILTYVRVYNDADLTNCYWLKRQCNLKKCCCYIKYRYCARWISQWFFSFGNFEIGQLWALFMDPYFMENGYWFWNGLYLYLLMFLRPIKSACWIRNIGWETWDFFNFQNHSSCELPFYIFNGLLIYI